jgi:uncharacterized YigZ family protein
MNYPIPAHFHSTETEIKKSRFIAWVKKVDDRGQAMAFLGEARKRYPDARHHCWAYQIGNPASPKSAAMSDDGEPSGTAGKPILNVLQHKGVGDVMVIIIRYFGGIKLGAGGLVRAYSGATEKVMSELPLQQQVAMKTVTVQVDFSDEQTIRHWLNQHQGHVSEINYKNNVSISATFPAEFYSTFQSFIASI